jgi:hypothetical protein
MNDPDRSITDSLVGSQLASVVFVRDYVQLVFEPMIVGRPEPGVLRPPTMGSFGTLSAYVLPELERQDRHVKSGQPGYRDVLVELIGRVLTAAGEDAARLRLVFDSGVIATISFDEGDRPAGAVESAMLQLDDPARSWMVW